MQLLNPSTKAILTEETDTVQFTSEKSGFYLSDNEIRIVSQPGAVLSIRSFKNSDYNVAHLSDFLIR